MSAPKPVTCESESEGDDVATELPARGQATPKKRSDSSSSTVTARQERPSDTQNHSRRGSTSGRSSVSKGSGDSPSVKRAPSVREPTFMPPPELVSASPTRKPNRPPAERGASTSRSTDGQRSTHSAPARAPSTKSRSDGRAEHGLPDNGVQARREQREVLSSSLSGEGLQRTTSQRASSRASRAPSRASQEMPPPPVPRARSASANRAPRPSSFHAGMAIPYDAYYVPYASPYGSYEHNYGPPPARSAYVDKGALGYPVRPPLSVMPVGPAAYYEPARVAVAHRAKTEYSTASTGSQYSARRPLSYYPDQPTAYDAPPARSQPPSPQRERLVSARQPARTSVHEDYMFSHDLSGSEDGSGEDDDDFEEGGKYMPRQQQPAQRSFNAHLSARGLPSTHHAAAAAALTGYGTSPHYDPADLYLDDGFVSSSDYRSSVRSKESAGSRSTHSRRLSIASSDRGTKATSYSASSGSGGYPSAARRIAGAYEQFQTTATALPQEHLADAERYIRHTDASAAHVRQQQPAVTQESLRLHNARAIEAKRSSRASSSSRMGGGVGGNNHHNNMTTATHTGTGTGIGSGASSSRRSRTITAAEEQTIKLNFDTSAGVNVELEGDTEGRPIKWVQQPGATTAQLIIGSGPGARDASTVYGDSVGQSGVSARTGSTRGAVSGRRDRARTEV